MSVTISTNLDKDELYDEIILFLNEIKVVRGGQDVYYTLRNHPKIRAFLELYQKEKIKLLENDIDNYL